MLKRERERIKVKLGDREILECDVKKEGNLEKKESELEIERERREKEFDKRKWKNRE
jgi:hypothetical protein